MYNDDTTPNNRTPVALAIASANDHALSDALADARTLKIYLVLTEDRHIEVPDALDVKSAERVHDWAGKWLSRLCSKTPPHIYAKAWDGIALALGERTEGETRLRTQIRVVEGLIDACEQIQSDRTRKKRVSLPSHEMQTLRF